MASLTVWKFDTADGAEQAAARLSDLQKQQLMTVVDAAVVTWREGKKKPKTRQLSPTTSVGALSGAFWGMLFGLIFLVPILGMAIGAAAGALGGKLTDVGIDDRFIKEVREQVTEGTSALFLMADNVNVERVREALGPGGMGHLIESNLTAEQEARLREAFGEDDE
jgi:uncharacterized membrane protein